MARPPFERPKRKKFQLLGGGEIRDRDTDLAAEHAAALEAEIVALVNAAIDASWYEHGNEADVATAALCRLRRAAAGAARGAEGGDEAVRRALEASDPAAVVWIASRVISYMDEQGFPDFVRL